MSAIEIGKIHINRYNQKVKNNLKEGEKNEVFNTLKEYMQNEDEINSNQDRETFRSTAYFMEANQAPKSRMVKTQNEFLKELHAEKLIQKIKFVNFYLIFRKRLQKNQKIIW